MKRKWTYFLGFLIVFFCIKDIYAQKRCYIFDHYNISNGLISDNIYKIFVDHTGYIWIITYNGIQKYNGYEFETYTAKPGERRSLSNNFVVNIYEDRDDDIIIVLDDGIDIYHKETDGFSNLFSNLPFAEVKRNEISRQASIVQDKDGFIWTSCHNRLVRIERDKRNYIIFPDEFKGHFILNHDSTALLIITESTLKRYDLLKKELTITNLEDIPRPVQFNSMNTIFYDSEGICWIGTSDGLYIFDEKNFRFLNPGLNFPSSSELAGRHFRENITAVYEDYNKDIWVASGSILLKIDRISRDVEILGHETENVNSLLEEQITGIYGDRSGTIWVTYLNEGFTRINIRTKKFRSYGFHPDSKYSLGGKTVRSVFKDRKNYIWTGLYNDGLDRINTTSNEIRHYRYDPDSEISICSNYISSLFVDENQRLWIGSHDNGLCYADEIYRDEIIFHKPSFLNQNDEVYHIQSDRFGRIWFATRRGLGMFSYKDGSFRWILEDHNVQSFLFDLNTIWIASWDYGLCRLNFNAEQFASDFPQFDSAKSMNYQVKETTQKVSDFSSNQIQNGISIFMDQYSNIWIGTYNKGLARVKPEGVNYSFTFYDESAGAPGNAVYGIAGDESGNIWISTEHGIGKFDPDKEHFENFYRFDGLLSDYFMWKSYYQAPDGEILFGNVDGLILFHPDEITTDSVNLPVVVSELKIRNQPVKCGDTINGEVVLRKDIIFQDTIILNYRNNYISLEFFARGQFNTDKIRYSHILEDYDDKWIIHDKGSRTANYMNLPPGTYHFRVKSSRAEGYWGEDYTEKKIIILPPWWKTKLAFAFYLLFMLGLIFLIFHSLVKFLKLKHELIYNEKLHQSKLMFFTYISHEFKTPLSLITAPLTEILTREGLSPFIRKNISLAKQNSENLLKLVNELMEFRRTDSGISKVKPEHIEMVSSINEIASQFQYIADQKDISFFINLPDEKINIWADIPKFRKIINNLIENSLKYTAVGGLISISVVKNPEKFRFRESYNTLHLNLNHKNHDYIGVLVSDTGIGISAESLPKIFDRFYQIEAERADRHLGSGIGLALVKNLVLLHHGEIRVASERGKGTDILVMFPIGNKHLTDDYPQDMQNSIFDKGFIKLPRKSEPVAESSVKEHPNNLPEILIVEDHEQLRTYLRENLSDEFKVLEASNGKEGLERIAKSHPDLIITDWIMPVMDGKSFLQEIKKSQNTSSIPVILLTALDELQDQQEGLDLGADQVVTKPFNLQLLKGQVKRMIENNHNRIRNYGTDHPDQTQFIRNSFNGKYLEKVDGVIRDNIRNTQLDAALIARELAVSRTALFTKIKEVSGMTPGEYIQRIRLKHAIKLMMYDNLSVSEVHVLIGMSSSSYFIRLFRKYYNTTPGEYIKNSSSIG